MKTFTITISEDEAMLARDALQNYHHELKGAPSERGQRLAKLSKALAEFLAEKIRLGN